MENKCSVCSAAFVSSMRQRPEPPTCKQETVQATDQGGGLQSPVMPGGRKAVGSGSTATTARTTKLSTRAKPAEIVRLESQISGPPHDPPPSHTTPFHMQMHFHFLSCAVPPPPPPPTLRNPTGHFKVDSAHSRLLTLLFCRSTTNSIQTEASMFCLV